MSFALRLVFAASFLCIVLDGPAANAQSRRPTRRGGNNSALTNELLRRFAVKQRNNWAMVHRAQSPAPIYRGVRRVNTFNGATIRTAPTLPNYPGGQRFYIWSVPYGGATYNSNGYDPLPNNGNGYGPTPDPGKSTYTYDPNALKSSTSGPLPR
jgi:hypothetical protein